MRECPKCTGTGLCRRSGCQKECKECNGTGLVAIELNPMLAQDFGLG